MKAMIDFDLLLQLSVAPFLVLSFMLFSPDPKPRLLQTLRYVRGFSWLFLFNIKVHHILFTNQLMQGNAFLTGYVSILMARPFYQVRIYMAALAVVFALLWLRTELNDQKQRLEIVRNVICTQLVFTMLTSNEIVLALQMVSFVWLFYAYVADHSSTDPGAVLQSVREDTKRGIHYGLTAAALFGGLLLFIIVGRAYGY